MPLWAGARAFTHFFTWIDYLLVERYPGLYIHCMLSENRSRQNVPQYIAPYTSFCKNGDGFLHEPGKSERPRYNNSIYLQYTELAFTSTK